MILELRRQTGGSVRKICEVLELPRSSFYHAAKSISSDEEDARLVELIPPKAQQRGARTELEFVEDDVASLGICRTATRVHADAICLGTHGRTGISRLVLGSVAQDVLARAQQVVVLAPAGSRTNS